MPTIRIKDLKPNSNLKFDFKARYAIHLDGTISYGNIPESQLYSLYKDGRVSGRLVEKLLSTIFCDLDLNPNTNGHYDLVHTKFGQSIEVRTVTARGTNTAPSYMIGKGRKYNYEEHLEKVKAISYFVLVDVTNTPLLLVGSFCDIDFLMGNKGKISYRAFLQNLPK